MPEEHTVLQCAHVSGHRSFVLRLAMLLRSRRPRSYQNCRSLASNLDAELETLKDDGELGILKRSHDRHHFALLKLVFVILTSQVGRARLQQATSPRCLIRPTLAELVQAGSGCSDSCRTLTMACSRRACSNKLAEISDWISATSCSADAQSFSVAASSASAVVSSCSKQTRLARSRTSERNHLSRKPQGSLAC